MSENSNIRGIKWEIKFCTISGFVLRSQSAWTKQNEHQIIVFVGIKNI